MDDDGREKEKMSANGVAGRQKSILISSSAKLSAAVARAVSSRNSDRKRDRPRLGKRKR